MGKVTPKSIRINIKFLKQLSPKEKIVFFFSLMPFFTHDFQFAPASLIQIVSGRSLGIIALIWLTLVSSQKGNN